MTVVKKAGPAMLILVLCAEFIGCIIGCTHRQREQDAHAQGSTATNGVGQDAEQPSGAESVQEVEDPISAGEAKETETSNNDNAAAASGPQIQESLLGTWQQILLNDAGKRFITEEEFLDWDSKCTISNNTIVWQRGVRRNVVVLHYTLDTTKTPHWIDLREDQRKIMGIVQLEEDILKICVGRERPSDFDPAGSSSENLIAFRRTTSSSVKVELADAALLDKAVSEFEEAALSGDAVTIDAARTQYHELKSQKKSGMFIGLLQHPDRRVRIETVRLFGTPSPSYGKVAFARPVLKELLRIVADGTQDVDLRRETVTTILQAYESTRRQLYVQLTDMGADGLFSVPALAAFIGDKQHRHWSAGGDFDAPIGAANLLESWGPDAAEAVPALTLALDHPNKWNFTPAVAKALGAIGPKARRAVPALQRAEQSNYEKLRIAAREALDQITVDEPEE